MKSLLFPKLLALTQTLDLIPWPVRTLPSRSVPCITVHPRLRFVKCTREAHLPVISNSFALKLKVTFPWVKKPSRSLPNERLLGALTAMLPIPLTSYTPLVTRRVSLRLRAERKTAPLARWSSRRSSRTTLIPSGKLRKVAGLLRQTMGALRVSVPVTTIPRCLLLSSARITWRVRRGTFIRVTDPLIIAPLLPERAF